MTGRPSIPPSPIQVGDALAWHVEGMDCASCVAKVRAAVERLPGVSSVEVNLMAERLTVQRTGEDAVPAAVERQVEALGYKATRLAPAAPAPAHDDGHQGNDHGGHDHNGAAGVSHAGQRHAHSEADEAEERVGTPWWRTGKARLVALLGGLVAFAWTLGHVFPAQAYWFYLAATLAAVVPFGRRAWRRRPMASNPHHRRTQPPCRARRRRLRWTGAGLRWAARAMRVR